MLSNHQLPRRLFSTAEKLQRFTNLPLLPEIETGRIVPMNYDEVDGATTDSKEVQICHVDGTTSLCKGS